MRASRGGRSRRLGALAVGSLIAVMGLVLAASSSQAHSPIETGQAASTPKTLAQCRAQFKHNRRARAACERRVKKAASTRPASGCTLINTWDGVGEGGDKRDFSVKLKVTGAEPGPYSAQIEVKILNSKVEICSATIAWYEGNGATGQHSAPVTIGAHGGVSSRASLPAGADAVLATVRAR